MVPIARIEGADSPPQAGSNNHRSRSDCSVGPLPFPAEKTRKVVPRAAHTAQFASHPEFS